MNSRYSTWGYINSQNNFIANEPKNWIELYLFLNHVTLHHGNSRVKACIGLSGTVLIALQRH